MNAVPEQQDQDQDMLEEIEAKGIIDSFVTMANIAAELNQDALDDIGRSVKEGYDIDKRSRSEWEDRVETWMKLAKMTEEKKSFPWPGAASIKYPVITQSSIQFAARAYPALIPDRSPVKGVIIGEDPDGAKAARAKRVGEHMSWQLTEQMEGWEEDTDKLLAYLPIVGMAYRKTYRDNKLKVNVSEFCTPSDVVVNYYAHSLERTPRITHRFALYPNEIKTMILAKDYLSFTFGSASDTDSKFDQNDKSAPHYFLEQHCWLDLDDDGLQEPYVATIHESTGKVVRITARFDSDGVIRNDEGDIIEFKPVHYFTKFSFIPSFDGSFYDTGFGELLAPGNEVINSTINQLLDAGTNANTGGGFISSTLLPGGAGMQNLAPFAPGEYKIVQDQSDDIRKKIWDRTVHEPSGITFNLLGLMIESQEKLSSIASILVGGQPVANVPATTSMATIEQALKLFTAIYKRTHRSLKSEYKKLRRLNKLFLDEREYFTVLDNQMAISKQDYQDADCDVVPASNPNDVTDTMRLLSAQALLELRGMGLNDTEINRRYLEALRTPDIEKLLPQEGDEQPDPAAMLEARKLAVEERRLALEEHKIRADAIKAKADSILSIAKAEAAEKGTQIQTYQAQVDAIEKSINLDGESEGAGDHSVA